MVRIRIFPHVVELTGAGPARLLDLLDAHEGVVGFPLSCRGGTCGACRVRILAGAHLLEPGSVREGDTLRALGAAQSERLGCQIQLAADADGTVELALSSISAAAES